MCVYMYNRILVLKCLKTVGTGIILNLRLGNLVAFNFNWSNFCMKIVVIFTVVFFVLCCFVTFVTFTVGQDTLILSGTWG